MNMKRMRNRGGHRHGGGGGGFRSTGGGGGHFPTNRNHVFDSTGPDMRIRGTAQQLFEKYLQLGRDATGAGDRVMAESYFQHAEHYFRILNAMNQAAGFQQGQGGQGQPQQRAWRNGPEQGGEGGEMDGGEGGYGQGEPSEGDRDSGEASPVAEPPQQG